MRIYIVVCGLYEDKHNAYATDNIDKAVQYALAVYHDDDSWDDSSCSSWDEFHHIEVWENGVLICEHYECRSKDDLSFSTFKENLEEDIREQHKGFGG